GNGHINAYDVTNGRFLGALADDTAIPLAIPTLWALTFGNGHLAGAADTLFFTAGLDDENHGLFGAIQAPEKRGKDTAGDGVFNPHAPGEPGDYPLPPRGGPVLREVSDERFRVFSDIFPMSQASLAMVPTLTSGSPRTRTETPLLDAAAPFYV